ncbi:DNA-damage-repair/toleration protein DRT102 [Platanthera guangdongensis]|uniref:DNA-damage-repair/toleration protein DRT102 n=1 Tax=Platanthera guangdongensis TaxID=2320717 RepID=A0ABR2MB37_9ASPA
MIPRSRWLNPSPMVPSPSKSSTSQMQPQGGPDRTRRLLLPFLVGNWPTPRLRHKRLRFHLRQPHVWAPPVVKFKAISLELTPPHIGHDVLVIKGRKKVWNLDENESYELGVVDYLFAPAGDKHRVMYFVDTWFFIRWDGDWVIFQDEELEAAASAIKVEIEEVINHISIELVFVLSLHASVSCCICGVSLPCFLVIFVSMY